MVKLSYQQKVLLANYEISKKSRGIKGLDKVWYSERGELFFRTQRWVNDNHRRVSGNFIVSENEIYTQIGATEEDLAYVRELEEKVKEIERNNQI